MKGRRAIADERVDPLLTRQEILERMARLAAEVAAGMRPHDAAETPPRWITPRELVQRMEPFLSSN